MRARLFLCAVLLTSCARPASPPASTGDAQVASSPDAARSARYLALGDSFTIGTGSTPAESFPSRWAARWENLGCVAAVRNLAVNGYTTDDVIAVELPEVHGFAPTRVTIAIGANDIVRGRTETAYRERLRTIFATLAKDGVVASTIFALPQPDWSRSPAAASFGDIATIGATIRAFNRALSEEALAAGARYVDIFPLMEEQAKAGMLASDGLHPSAAAYDAWANALAAQVPLPCP